MKRSIVLLITLFFITTISVYILKSLDDSKKLIDSVSIDTTLTQLNISNKNIENEIKLLLDKYSDNIDDVLEILSMGIPFHYKNIETFILLDDFSSSGCSINKIKKVADIEKLCGEKFVDNIIYPDDFISILKQHKHISTKSQLDFVIAQYIKETNDDKISKINFDYIDLDMKDDKRYLQCTYDIKYNGIVLKTSFIYEISKKTISYKRYTIQKDNTI